MTKLPARLWRLLSSGALTPAVIAIFLLVYAAIAFLTDEALIVLMQLVRGNLLLCALLALIPVNSACCLIAETRAFIHRRRLLAGADLPVLPGLFDEEVAVGEGAAPAQGTLSRIKGNLEAEGYRTRLGERDAAAWRGLNSFPARFLYLVGVFCLFAGILVSLTTRTSLRGAVAEGEPLPGPGGEGQAVSRITYAKVDGLILSKRLIIENSDSRSGRKEEFGIYPPARYQGAFVYPRYLGVGVAFHFAAPELPAGFQQQAPLAIYPPGKAAEVPVQDTGYRLRFSLQAPADGSDPYITGKMALNFKILQGSSEVASGTLPAGAEFVRDGYRLAIQDTRRVVITDLIRDNGVIPIWFAGVIFALAFCYWLAVRLVSPRRELIFTWQSAPAVALSRAEGRSRRHNEQFHEALDRIAGDSGC
ncbi:hypothetical protein GMST_30490 [Geomonas silvestris]|uniref:ResB-like domain-containing protein n=1 Tax=Geomonas silvestris TaxID=2740184 RepID=A0A6V8MLC2_9BACT|nr:hypothetical protein [Geomonas silvestris]GFO60724.1 hypothetical protein GMST_30490 [Geomonas silvestris]